MIRVHRVIIVTYLINILLLDITKFEKDKGPKGQTKIIDAPVTKLRLSIEICYFMKMTFSQLF